MSEPAIGGIGDVLTTGGFAATACQKGIELCARTAPDRLILYRGDFAEFREFLDRHIAHDQAYQAALRKPG